MIIRSREWLVIKRAELGMTQKEFANMCQLTLSTIQNIEQGKRLGSSETWDKIESAIKYLSDENYILNDSSNIVNRLRKLLKIYTGNYTICVFYELKENNIVFTDFALAEQLAKLKNTFYKNKKYMKTTLIDAIDLFKFQNEI